MTCWGMAFDEVVETSGSTSRISVSDSSSTSSTSDPPSCRCAFWEMAVDGLRKQFSTTLWQIMREMQVLGFDRNQIAGFVSVFLFFQIHMKINERTSEVIFCNCGFHWTSAPDQPRVNFPLYAALLSSYCPCR